MKRKSWILPSVAAVVAVAAVVLTAGAGDDPPAPAAAAASDTEDRAAFGQGAPLTVDPDVARPSPEPRASEPRLPTRELLLPDGTRVPTLNGAVGAAPLARAWSPQVPYSPIVGVERSDAGVDWYVHADGTRSTTVMKYRPDLGREDAVTRVAHPGPAPPQIDRR